MGVQVWKLYVINCSGPVSVRAASSPAGSDGNSMDSVDSCCGLRKPDGFQNAQAGSNPKKVDLIIWEIEVPKVRAASTKWPRAPGQQAWERGPRWGPKAGEAPGEPEAEGVGMLCFAQVWRAPAARSTFSCPWGQRSHTPRLLPSSGLFLVCRAQISLEMLAK